ITPSSTDLWLDRLALIGLLFLWIYTIVNYAGLPEIIPAHYNLKGEVNRYGSKAIIFVLPIVLTILVTGLTILKRYPHIFNYPVTLTEENAESEYRTATRLIRYLKFIIVAFFIFIN